MGGAGDGARPRRRPGGRTVTVLLVSLVALLATPAAVADPPALSGVPGDQVLEATSSAGAVFSWPDPTASDGDGNPTEVACTPESGTTFPIATTTVTCTATDLVTLDESSQSFTVTVQDTTPPTVTVPGSMTAPATGPGGAVVTFSASASDIVDGAIAPSCSPSSGSTFPLGTTTVTCNATDSRGNTGSSSFSVTVADTTPPTLTLPADITAQATGPAGAAVTFAASASDLVDPSPSVVCSPPSGSTFPLGTTTVTCTATDGSGNSSSGSFAVTVQDTTPPTLTVPSAVTVEATGSGGATVSFTATATDLVDPAPAVDCSPPSGSTFAITTTTVSCTATDGSGNTSAPKTFTVTVRDTTPPTVTVPQGFTVEATGANGAAATFSASATDIVDGSLTPTCTPASGATFPLGVTTVACTATDSRSNSSTAQFKVTVRDTKGPVFSAVPSDRTAEADGPRGSRVAYPSPSAVDVVSGPVLVACVPDSGSLFPLGATVVSCTARDAAGNVTGVSFAVEVVDTTKPTLNPPQSQEVSSRGAPTLPRTDPQVVAFLAAASAQDLVDGPVAVTNDAPEELPLGTTRITFTATDRAGNVASAQADLTVVTGTAKPTVQDTTPPKDVTRLTAKAGDRSVRLTWVPPKADFHHVVITRSPGRGGAPSSVVYRGSAKELRDANLTNGVEYRYVVVVVDKVGNSSRGVVARAVPRRPMLYAPLEGVVVTRPPTLRWLPVAGATYYNVQLFRARSKAGRLGAKILSAWPSRPRYTLKRTWKYDGRVQRLTPGRYIWFAWAGFGAKSANRYGPVLGQSTFTVR